MVVLSPVVPWNYFCVRFKRWLIECVVQITHLDYTFEFRDNREGRVVALCFRIARNKKRKEEKKLFLLT